MSNTTSTKVPSDSTLVGSTTSDQTPHNNSLKLVALQGRTALTAEELNDAQEAIVSVEGTKKLLADMMAMVDRQKIAKIEHESAKRAINADIEADVSNDVGRLQIKAGATGSFPSFLFLAKVQCDCRSLKTKFSAMIVGIVLNFGNFLA